jgi:hypothetical protein
MKRLIQTNFSYLDGSGWKDGSYLGRKPASEATVRRFLAETAKKYGVKRGRVRRVILGTSFESPWIHK